MTRYLVDTSVAVPYVMANHTAHRLVQRSIGGRNVWLAGHAGVETYSVLTRLPGDARLTPADALELIEDRFEGVATARGGTESIRRLVSAGIQGGATYDGLVALSVKANDVLFSRDLRASATYSQLGITVELIADRT